MNKLEKQARDSLKAWNAHDVDKILSEWTDDCIREDVALGTLYRGKAEVRATLESEFSAFPDFKLEFKSVIASGDRVATEWVTTGTFKGVLTLVGIQPTGKAFSLRGVSIVEMRGDKIKRFTEYYDSSTLFKQLGITA